MKNSGVVDGALATAGYVTTASGVPGAEPLVPCTFIAAQDN